MLLVDTNNLTDIGGCQTDLIFHYGLQAVRQYIFHIMIAIVIFGLASNSTNIAVFLKMGLKDNVTITVLFLSISDLLYLLFQSPTIVGGLLVENHPDFDLPFNPLIILLVPYWYSYLFYDYSSMISVFLGVVRCACVARPLRFKTMFTRCRTLTILSVMFIVALALSSPVLTVFRLTKTMNPNTNSSYISLAISSNIRLIYRTNEIVNRNIIPWVAYTTVTTCVVILASKLQETAKFRRSMTNRTHSRGKQSHDPDDKKSTQKMSAKNLQVIQSVTLICAIFIFSQLPYQLISILRFLLPEFSSSGKAKHLYAFAAHIKNVFTYINASVNIFVYLRFNARYKKQFVHLFSCKKRF